MSQPIVIYTVCGIAVSVCVVLLLYIRRVAINAHSLYMATATAQPEPDPPVVQGPELPPEPLISGDGTIRALSERLASLEGMVPALRAQIESYTALAQRLAALETYVPNIADAYERFTDSSDRQQKRDGERERYSKKREAATAGDAANALLGLPGQGPAVPGPVVPGAAGKKRNGIVGGGGRGRRV